MPPALQLEPDGCAWLDIPAGAVAGDDEFHKW
jgi:hypothetical protein